MIVWARPADAPTGTRWCAVLRVDASVHTGCRGRWVPSDADEIRWTAPADERCRACEAAVETQRRVLAELADLRVRLGQPDAWADDVAEQVNGPPGVDGGELVVELEQYQRARRPTAERLADLGALLDAGRAGEDGASP